ARLPRRLLWLLAGSLGGTRHPSAPVPVVTQRPKTTPTASCDDEARGLRVGPRLTTPPRPKRCHLPLWNPVAYRSGRPPIPPHEPDPSPAARQRGSAPRRRLPTRSLPVSR